jgi:hypothetical protein
MAITRVAEDRAALCQRPQATLVERCEPSEIIETHLVDRQDQHELWPRWRLLASQRQKRRERNRQACQE